jgi:hypothetical protein
MCGYAIKNSLKPSEKNKYKLIRHMLIILL